MVSSGIWEKTRTSFSKTSYLWPLKNPQMSREIRLLLIDNVHEKIWTMYLQRTGLQCSQL